MSLLGSLTAAYRDRLTARGRWLAWVVVACALLGVDTRRSQAFVLFAGAASMLLAASGWIALGLARPRVQLACPVPTRATAGRAVRVDIALRATRDVDLELTLPVVTTAPHTLGHEPGHAPARKAHLRLLAGEEAELPVELRFQRRGRHAVRWPRVRGLDPMGLSTSRAPAPAIVPVLVHPRRFPTAPPRFDDAGARHADVTAPRARDDGFEPLGTRPYRPGDPRRRIHWRSFARRGVPVVKELAIERAAAPVLLLDLRGAEPDADRLGAAREAAISVAASLVEASARGATPLAGLWLGPQPCLDDASRDAIAPLDPVRALDALALASELHPPLDERHAPVLAATHDGRRGGPTSALAVLAVLLDWDEVRRRFFLALRAQGAEVRLVIVRGGETTLPIDEGPGLRVLERLSPAAIEARLRAAEST